jgi:formylglycine-generating enzyme required for sulfatase activity
MNGSTCTGLTGLVCSFTAIGYRLPTESEWEYACRAGGTTKWYFGDMTGITGNYGWVSSVASNQTHPVAQKIRNNFGLYDLYGNVWEWCQDWYGSTYYQSSPASNPRGPATGSYRVVRGGSWSANDATDYHSADRYMGAAGGVDSDLGFRVVRPE